MEDAYLRRPSSFSSSLDSVAHHQEPPRVVPSQNTTTLRKTGRQLSRSGDDLVTPPRFLGRGLSGKGGGWVSAFRTRLIVLEQPFSPRFPSTDPRSLWFGRPGRITCGPRYRPCRPNAQGGQPHAHHRYCGRNPTPHTMNTVCFCFARALTSLNAQWGRTSRAPAGTAAAANRNGREQVAPSCSAS